MCVLVVVGGRSWDEARTWSKPMDHQLQYEPEIRINPGTLRCQYYLPYKTSSMLFYKIKSPFFFFLQEYDKTLYLSCISLMAGSTKKTAPISLTSLALSSRPAVFWWLNWTSLDGWDNFSGLKTAEPSLAPCQWNRATILTCSGSETDLTRHGGKAQARRRKPHNEVLSN